MRFNERQMIIVSHQEADFEDRLNYKKVVMLFGTYQSKGFKQFWFKLKYNLLFYFKFNEFGQIDNTQPAGLMVLENYIVQYEDESNTPFAFSITFQGDTTKHVFSARSEEAVKRWVTVIKDATYERMKQELIFLEEKLAEKKQRNKRLDNVKKIVKPQRQLQVRMNNGKETNSVENLIEF